MPKQLPELVASPATASAAALTWSQGVAPAVPAACARPVLPGSAWCLDEEPVPRPLPVPSAPLMQSQGPSQQVPSPEDEEPVYEAREPTERERKLFGLDKPVS